MGCCKISLMKNILNVAFLNLGGTHVSLFWWLNWSPRTGPCGLSLASRTNWTNNHRMKLSKKSLCFSNLRKTWEKQMKSTQHICHRESETLRLHLPSNLCSLQDNWTQCCVSTEFRVHFTTVRSRARKKKNEGDSGVHYCFEK